jgi:hypothetical protein
MPSMGRQRTTSVLEDIYSEYAAVVTVPLTIDWGNRNKARSVIRHHEKELPPPPAIKIDPGCTSPPLVVGRRGFGIESRSSSPLSREWSDESAEEREDMPGLVRRSAMKRRSEKVQSTDSVESVWFGMDIYSILRKALGQVERNLILAAVLRDPGLAAPWTRGSPQVLEFVSSIMTTPFRRPKFTSGSFTKSPRTSGMQSLIQIISKLLRSLARLWHYLDPPSSILSRRVRSLSIVS